jgi:hypothetical protein
VAQSLEALTTTSRSNVCFDFSGDDRHQKAERCSSRVAVVTRCLSIAPQKCTRDITGRAESPQGTFANNRSITKGSVLGSWPCSGKLLNYFVDNYSIVATGYHMDSRLVGGHSHESGEMHRSMSHHKATPRLRRKQNDKCRGSYSTISPRNLCDSRAFFSVLFFLTLWINTATARTYGDQRSFGAILVLDTDAAWQGSSLSIDHRPPPIVSLMSPLHQHEETTTTLAKRAVGTDPNGVFPTPQPLDSGLSNNFTSSCASFLSRLRGDGAFQNCHPFSLLLQVRVFPLRKKKKLKCLLAVDLKRLL